MRISDWSSDVCSSDLIANTIDEVLKPKGVAVVIEGEHQCMTTRGIGKDGVSMVTSRQLGAFRDDSKTRREFLRSEERRVGKRVSVSVDTGGRRHIQKNKRRKYEYMRKTQE